MKTLIEAFSEYIGVREYDGIVAVIQKWYWGRLVKEAWCATSLSYFANECGILDQLGGKNAGVWEMMNACKARHESDGRFVFWKDLDEIQTGDVIFMQRNGASHVTIATINIKYASCEKTIPCLGGNQNDMICIKEYAMNKITAIYRPYYDDKTYKGRKVTGMKDLERGMKDDRDIITLQLCLASRKLYAGEIDGSFGPKTEAAVCKFQDAHGVTPLIKYPGTVGPTTWGALFTEAYHG